MVILIFGNKEILDEIGATLDIEDGIGPVLIGEPVESEDGRFAIAHPFASIDIAWFEAYTSGENPPVVVCEEFPADFVPVIPGGAPQ